MLEVNAIYYMQSNAYSHKHYIDVV